MVLLLFVTTIGSLLVLALLAAYLVMLLVSVVIGVFAISGLGLLQLLPIVGGLMELAVVLFGLGSVALVLDGDGPELASVSPQERL